MSGHVNQESVAAELGFTPRRVRQLVDEGVLSAPVDGLHDIVEARRRYDLYRLARDGQTGTAAWAEALDELELLAREAEAAAAAAEKKASRDTARNAAQAALRFTDWWRFVARCRSRTEEERQFVAGIIEANETALLSVAVTAGMKAASARSIVFPGADQ